MCKVKKRIESYEELRKCIGRQYLPTTAETELVFKLYQEQVENVHPDPRWGLLMVYLLGKVKGSGKVSQDGLSRIVETLEQEKTHRHANDEKA